MIATAAALKMVTTDNVVHAALYLLIVLAAVAAVYVDPRGRVCCRHPGHGLHRRHPRAVAVRCDAPRARIGGEDDLNYPQRWIGALVAASLAAVMGYSLWEAFGDDQLPDDRMAANQRRRRLDLQQLHRALRSHFGAAPHAALIGAVVVARKD
ncbi:MAG: hypothetical protein R2710_09540 [Acidimicrobiales bacterium]